MALAIVCIICLTWLITLGVLTVRGLPTITKVTKHTECAERNPDYEPMHVPGFGTSDTSQGDSDAAQEEIRKAAVEFDIAAAVNAFIEGDSK